MIKIDEVERNTNVFVLTSKLLSEERFGDVVMLGEILIGDKHPSILKSFEIITNMCKDEKVIQIRKKIKLKLEEHRAEYGKEDNTLS